jgi:glycosyltransferase involved in cell wall biosynthesis
MTPRIVVVHNNIDQRSSIGKLATWAIRVALEANYSVVAVARDIDPSIRADVEYRRLHVPRAVFAYQWARALGTVKAALAEVRYDILHTYQAQLTGIADTWHVEFLTRSAVQAGAIPQGSDALSRWRRAQVRTVAVMEDRYLRRLSDKVNVLFPSQLMLREFSKLYGEPPRHKILPNPVAAVDDISVDERRHARQDLVGEFDGTVVGYLGGLDDRKGWRELANGIAAATDSFLLFGGTDSQKFRDPRLEGRCRTVGYVDDLTRFLAACDVLAVPSRFDPYALVVVEAAAQGVPSITTSMVGVQEEVVKYGAGASWDGRADTFPEVVSTVAYRRVELAAGARKMAAELSERKVSARLLQCWSEAVERRASTNE